MLTQASQTVTNVSNTYWDLVAAWRDVAIQEEGLRNAQAQAASNARLAQRGAAAPVDVVESNTQINVFQDNVFSALQRVQRCKRSSRASILASPADPLWVANLVPTSPVLQLPPEPNLDDLMMTALRNRPELAQLRAQRLVAAANLAYAKNQSCRNSISASASGQRLFGVSRTTSAARRSSKRSAARSRRSIS